MLPAPPEAPQHTNTTAVGQENNPQSSGVERAPGGAEQAVGPALAVPTTPTVAPVNAVDPVPLQQPIQQTNQSSVSPAVADDVDVIEKEWVDKAKQIVAQTKDNPHQQEKEVSKLQADYLMKRYGKNVKLVE